MSRDTFETRLFETRPFQIHFSFKTLCDLIPSWRMEEKKKNELSIAYEMIKWLMQRECSCYQWTCQVILNCVSRRHPTFRINRTSINRTSFLLSTPSVLFEKTGHAFFFPIRKRLEWTQANATHGKKNCLSEKKILLFMYYLKFT